MIAIAILNSLCAFSIFAACLPQLSTLQITHNKLSTLESVIHLKDCLAISVLDLSHNRLEQPEIIEEVFAKMPALVRSSSFFNHQCCCYPCCG